MPCNISPNLTPAGGPAGETAFANAGDVGCGVGAAGFAIGGNEATGGTEATGGDEATGGNEAAGGFGVAGLALNSIVG